MLVIYLGARKQQGSDGKEGKATKHVCTSQFQHLKIFTNSSFAQEDVRVCKRRENKMRSEDRTPVGEDTVNL